MAHMLAPSLPSDCIAAVAAAAVRISARWANGLTLTGRYHSTAAAGAGWSWNTPLSDLIFQGATPACLPWRGAS